MAAAEAAAEAAAVVEEVWKLKNLKEKQKNTEDTREKHVEIEESKQLTDCVKGNVDVLPLLGRFFVFLLGRQRIAPEWRP